MVNKISRWESYVESRCSINFRWLKWFCFAFSGVCSEWGNMQMCYAVASVLSTENLFWMSCIERTSFAVWNNKNIRINHQESGNRTQYIFEFSSYNLKIFVYFSLYGVKKYTQTQTHTYMAIHLIWQLVNIIYVWVTIEDYLFKEYFHSISKM